MNEDAEKIELQIPTPLIDPTLKIIEFFFKKEIDINAALSELALSYKKLESEKNKEIENLNKN